MNILVMLAGVTALMTTVGHFTAGTQMYLKPLLESDIEPVAKKVLHCVFHYVSTFLILSTIALFMVAFEKVTGSAGCYLARFVATNFAVFAAWQLVLAKQSGIPGAAGKMFQWVFFVVIAVLAWFGTSPVAPFN